MFTLRGQSPLAALIWKTLTNDVVLSMMASDQKTLIFVFLGLSYKQLGGLLLWLYLFVCSSLLAL